MQPITLTPELTESHLEEIHTSAGRIALAREDRDEAIRVAFADGVPVPKIADAAGMTRQRIWQIVR